MALGAILGAAGSVLGSLFSAGQANRAANAQEAIGREQIDLFRNVQQQQTNALAPFLRGGTIANDAYLYELGLGAAPAVGGMPAQVTVIPGTTTGGRAAVDPVQLRIAKQRADTLGGEYVRRYQAMLAASNAPGTTTPTMYEVAGRRFGTMDEANAFARANPTGGTAYGGFTKTPGYDFRMREGMDALQSSAAARGNLFSGATMRAAQQFGQDYASSEYQSYLDRLAGLASGGAGAATGQAASFGQTGANIANALGGIGDARSAGYIARGNAFANGIDNAISAYSYLSNRDNVTRPQANPFR